MSKLNRRTFLRVTGLAASSAVAAACGGSPAPTVAPTTAPEATVAPEATAAPAATTAPEATAAPAATTAPEATAASVSKYSEAPMLAEMVAAGSLPPVDERLPGEPLIQEVVEEIGEYGGTWYRAAVSVGDTALWSRLCPDAITYFNIPGDLVPSIAKSWDISEDGKEFTFHLREGMKWSDGAPYTADAYLWWYEHIMLNEELTPTKPSWMRVGGEYGTVAKVDDYTFTVTFSTAYGTFLEWIANAEWHGAPGHYLEQFHPDFTDQAEIEGQAKEAGFEQWFQLFNDKNSMYNNPDRPVVGAWKFSTLPDQNPMIAERNPYYFRVDPQGNQLPYIDRIQFEIVTSAEVLNFMAIAGDLSCQSRQINIANYPLFAEGGAAGDYRMIIWPNDGGADAGLMVNQNAGQQEGANEHQVSVGQLLQTTDFRYALSVAVDRDEIWNSAFLGLGEPRQMAPLKGSKYYEDGMELFMTEFDPDKANQMLDDLGLDKRDADGFRLGPDGQVLDITVSAVDQFGPWVDSAQLASSHWNAVGIKSVVNVEERTLYYTRMAAGEHQVAVWNTGGNGKLLIYPYWAMPFSSSSRIGPLSGIWYQSGGTQGVEPTGDLRRVLDLFDEATVTIDMPAQDEMAREIFRINLNQLWTIGTVGASPMVMGLVIVKNNFRNVPGEGFRVWNEDSVHTPANCVPAQYFMRQA